MVCYVDIGAVFSTSHSGLTDSLSWREVSER